MLTCKWTWENIREPPQILPYGPILLMPTPSIIHYATSCFKGMKLFRGDDSRLRLFQPQLNCSCFLDSALRISLLAFDPNEILNLIKICAYKASKWLPIDQTGCFLYARATPFASESSLGFEIPREAQLVVMLSRWPVPLSTPTTQLTS